ncbi:MAG: sensor histidine kinase [Bacteroidetes bacterium]|nr:sensor histidine kinase [Bacteroidota bacterium]
MSPSRKLLFSFLAVALVAITMMGIVAFGSGRSAIEQFRRGSTEQGEEGVDSDDPNVRAAIDRLRLHLILGGLVVLVVSGGAALMVSRAASRQLGGQVATSTGSPDSMNRERIALKHEVLERQRVEKELKDSQEQLRNLSAHLEAAREGERKRIARDIHDDLGQALTTLKLDLSLLREEVQGQSPHVVQKLHGMSQLVDATIRSVKRLITELRPRLLDDLGLPAAIEWQAEEFQKRTGIPLNLSIYPEEIILDADRSTALFRIFQETLVNVARHAEASSVWANLTEIDGVVELEVRDDGKGISDDQINDPRSYGLIGIRERAYSWGGEVDISGSPTSGTRVRVRFTLPDEEDA